VHQQHGLVGAAVALDDAHLAAARQHHPLGLRQRLARAGLEREAAARGAGERDHDACAPCGALRLTQRHHGVLSRRSSAAVVKSSLVSSSWLRTRATAP